MVRREFSISAEEAGQRLDHVVRQRLPDVPRRIQSSWFAGGHVRLDGAVAKKGCIAASGQLCRVDAIVDTPVPPLPGDRELSVLFENEHVVLIDKPAGMASAALAGSAADSVAAHLNERYPVMKDIGYSVWDAGLIHRLDTDTSGVMVAAKTRTAFEELVAALVGAKLTKSYLAWTTNCPTPENGVITTWLRSDPKHRQRMTAARPHQAGAKPCETRYEVIARESDFYVVRASAALATRHQVRAHLAAIGSPLVADALYGGPASQMISRHALHAERVRFEGGAVCPGFDCRAKIPRDLAALTPQFAESANAH